MTKDQLRRKAEHIAARCLAVNTDTAEDILFVIEAVHRGDPQHVAWKLDDVLPAEESAEEFDYLVAGIQREFADLVVETPPPVLTVGNRFPSIARTTPEAS